MRICFIVVLFLIASNSSSAQSDTLLIKGDLLQISYLKGEKQKTIMLNVGQRLKVDLNNGERKKGVIDSILSDRILLNGIEVMYSDISVIKNRGYSKSIGLGLMTSGGAGILGGAAIAGMGALMISSEQLLPIILGVAAVIGGAIIAIYAGVAVLTGAIIELATKKIEVESDQVQFELIPLINRESLLMPSQ